MVILGMAELPCWDGFWQALLGRSGQGHGSVVEAWSLMANETREQR